MRAPSVGRGAPLKCTAVSDRRGAPIAAAAQPNLLVPDAELPAIHEDATIPPVCDEAINQPHAPHDQPKSHCPVRPRLPR